MLKYKNIKLKIRNYENKILNILIIKLKYFHNSSILNL